MSDEFLRKLIVTVIALLVFVVWNIREHQTAEGCTVHCATDFSAMRK
jgi:hypothetical protein